jgi:hypothetical protein
MSLTSYFFRSAEAGTVKIPLMIKSSMFWPDADTKSYLTIYNLYEPEVASEKTAHVNLGESAFKVLVAVAEYAWILRGVFERESYSTYSYKVGELAISLL